MREIILDTETTGLNFEDGDRVIEIGACEMIDYVLTGNNLHLYINPETDIKSGASSIHGLKNEDLKDKPVFSEVSEEFLEFIGDSRLIIHNASFDIGFLNNELKISGSHKKIENEVLDTLILAKKLLPGSLVNLDSLCRRFNIDLSVRKKHGALVDTLLLAEVYIELIGGKQTSLVFDKDEIAEEKPLKNSFDKITRKVEIKKRNFEPKKQEIIEHRKFIKCLKGAIWKKYI